MSIYKRGSTWWAYIRIKGKPRVRMSLETTDRLEAEEKEHELRLKLVDGREKRNLGTKPPTLEEAFERFINRYEGESRRVAWSQAESVMAVLGKETTLDTIDEPMISGMIDQFVEDGNTPATINRKTSTLSQMLKVAYYEWRVIHRIPYIKRFRESQGRIRVITHDEEAQLVKLFKSYGEHDMADLVIFLVDTGCRLSEGLKLMCEDVGWSQRCLYVWKPKNKIPRVVPLTTRVNEMLKERCKANPETHRPFGTLDSPHVTYVWRKARKDMGLENDGEFTIHALRHTTATRLINAGVSIYVVQHFLGHSTVKVTERYAHLDSSQLRDAAATLEEIPEHFKMSQGDIPRADAHGKE